MCQLTIIIPCNRLFANNKENIFTTRLIKNDDGLRRGEDDEDDDDDDSNDMKFGKSGNTFTQLRSRGWPQQQQQQQQQ
jgi:hypothetical protein